MMVVPPATGLLLHIVESGGVYGIERVLLNLLPALQRQGHRAGLACMSGAGSVGAQVGEAAADLGVPVWYVGYSRRISASGLLRLHRTIVSCKPRIVHLHGYKATILAGAVCLARRLPTFATYHGEASKALDLPRLAMYRAMEAQVLRRIRGVVAVSEPVGEELVRRRVPRQLVCVIPNGISAHTDQREATTVLAPSGFAPMLLVAGRLIREKNVGLALEVLARVRERHPTAGLVVAGEGRLRSALQEEARALGVAEWVRFLGFVKDVRGLFSRCDCFLLPSSTEGMPIALLEAMAAGAPIVASRVGGIPAAITDGVEGLLVPPGDAELLFSAVSRLLDDPALRQLLGAGARARFAREFTDDRMAEAYAALYDRVLGAS